MQSILSRKVLQTTSTWRIRSLTGTLILPSLIDHKLLHFWILSVIYSGDAIAVTEQSSIHTTLDSNLSVQIWFSYQLPPFREIDNTATRRVTKKEFIIMLTPLPYLFDVVTYRPTWNTAALFFTLWTLLIHWLRSATTWSATVTHLRSRSPAPGVPVQT